MLQMVLGLFVSVALARYLGPNNFGLFSYVLSIVTLLSVFTSLGLEELARRELVQEPARRDVILGTCFLLRLLAGVITYAAMLFTVGLVSDHSLLLGLFALFGGTLLLNPLQCIEIWFQSQLRSDLSVTANSIALVLSAIIKVMAIYSGADLLNFAYIFLFELAVLTGLKSFFYQRHFARLFAWRSDLSLAKEFLRQSWPLLLSGLAVMIYMKVDQIMLGAMLGNEAVGQYSVAVRISSIWYMIPTILATSLFPAIMNARKQNAQIYEQRLQHYFDLNAGLAYLICVPLTITAPWIITTFFGEQYEAAGPILAVHAWTSLFVFMGVARKQYLVAENMFKFSLVCTVTGALLNLIMNYFLIPFHGGLGAAMASLVSFAIAGFLSSLLLVNSHSIMKRQLFSMFVPRLLLITKKLFFDEYTKHKNKIT